MDLDAWLKKKMFVPPSDAFDGYQQVLENVLRDLWIESRKSAIEECVLVLKGMHGDALAKHNYYAHAAIQIKNLRK